jgi:hypothetical protein
MTVSTGMEVIYVQVNDGDAHDGIDRELMLSLMGQDEPAGALVEHEGQACHAGQAGLFVHGQDVGVLRKEEVSFDIAGWLATDLACMQVFIRQKFDIFILFSTSVLAAHVEKWPWRPKIRHGLDMPSGPGTLVARTLLLVNLQPAQTGSAMSSCYQKRREEARRWHSAHQNLRSVSQKRTFKNSTWFWQNSTCPRHQCAQAADGLILS